MSASDRSSVSLDHVIVSLLDELRAPIDRCMPGLWLVLGGDARGRAVTVRSVLRADMSAVGYPEAADPQGADWALVAHVIDGARGPDRRRVRVLPVVWDTLSGDQRVLLANASSGAIWLEDETVALGQVPRT